MLSTDYEYLFSGRFAVLMGVFVGVILIRRYNRRDRRVSCLFV
jgi:hypothetical protein